VPPFDWNNAVNYTELALLAESFPPAGVYNRLKRAPSKGGALATLLVVDVALKTSCKNPAGYTFASPRRASADGFGLASVSSSPIDTGKHRTLVSVIFRIRRFGLGKEPLSGYEMGHSFPESRTNYLGGQVRAALHEMMKTPYFRGVPKMTEDLQRTEDSQRPQKKEAKKPYIKPAFRFERVSESAAFCCGKMPRPWQRSTKTMLLVQ